MLFAFCFKKINFIDEDVAEPIIAPILKKKKKDDEVEISSHYVVASYKKNQLFENSLYSVKTYKSNEKKYDGGWKPASNDIENNNFNNC